MILTRCTMNLLKENLRQNLCHPNAALMVHWL
ncbi:hypothetical protein T07_1291 [Trichinella nelsoni]|uniref:Uncharacterized protein n=1 Tax=Trichinella nelsoni TaxID=6336 RepID=A0A0V0RCM5_9BILA|nr:hypothetical protein T07_1291 [Trichinella nelsoni]